MVNIDELEKRLKDIINNDKTYEGQHVKQMSEGYLIISVDFYNPQVNELMKEIIRFSNENKVLPNIDVDYEDDEEIILVIVNYKY